MPLPLSDDRDFAFTADDLAACVAHVVGDGLAEGEDAGGIAVAGAAGVEGRAGHPVEVRRAAEVGCAQVEADDVHSPVDASLDVVAELEGVLGAQVAHAAGDQGHGVISWWVVGVGVTQAGPGWMSGGCILYMT